MSGESSGATSPNVVTRASSVAGNVTRNDEMAAPFTTVVPGAKVASAASVSAKVAVCSTSTSP
jgi:hypothetical protein